MKNRKQQIAGENASAMMNGKFSFDLKEILNKPLLFDTTKIDEQITMDMIIHALPADNDDYNTQHPIGSNSFTLKREAGRLKKASAKSKKHV